MLYFSRKVKKGERFIITIIKDIWTKTRGWLEMGREVGRAEVVGRGGEEGQKTLLEQQQQKIKK